MKKAILIIVALGILLLIGAYWSKKSVDDMNPTETATSTEGASVSTSTTLGMRTGPNALLVIDQKPGKEITIAAVRLDEDGYVEIHEMTADGKPGNPIGVSKLLEAGDSTDVKISLTRSLLEGDKLIAMLHKDDGDSKFLETKDLPIVDSQNAIVMMPFAVNKNAPESVDINF